MSQGNAPASSKFNMIRDCKLPKTGQMLFSFIGLVTFYHKYIPYQEIRIKPLRKLLQTYFRSPIPIMAWSPSLIELFEDLKICITSSPILNRFDPTKPFFLKTDWSSYGMGYILMQPAQDSKSVAATQLLKESEKCIFDLTSDGARLLPI